MAAARRRRRSTFPTCEPNTPRYTWASSTTTKARLARSWPQAGRVGRIPPRRGLIVVDQSLVAASQLEQARPRFGVPDRGHPPSIVAAEDAVHVPRSGRHAAWARRRASARRRRTVRTGRRAGAAGLLASWGGGGPVRGTAPEQ